jgi:hypothetical protein
MLRGGEEKNNPWTRSGQGSRLRKLQAISTSILTLISILTYQLFFLKALMKPLHFITLILSVSVLIPCCKDNSTDPGTNDTFPASNLSYTDHIQPIFNTYCGVVECHDSYSRAQNLDLTSYYGATARAGIIVPKNANSSILVQRIAGSIQPQMPLYRPPLSTNKIQAIKTWINEGAENN